MLSVCQTVDMSAFFSPICHPNYGDFVHRLDLPFYTCFASERGLEMMGNELQIPAQLSMHVAHTRQRCCLGLRESPSGLHLEGCLHNCLSKRDVFSVKNFIFQNADLSRG